MTVLADTSGIIALLDESDQHHSAAVKVVQSQTLWIPSTILPEVDYMVTKYLGERVAVAFLEDLVQGSFVHITVDTEDIKRALLIINKYKDVPLGLVDASVVALVERYRIEKVLTLDRRHFSLIRPKSVPYLQLLP